MNPKLLSTIWKIIKAKCFPESDSKHSVAPMLKHDFSQSKDSYRPRLKILRALNLIMIPSSAATAAVRFFLTPSTIQWQFFLEPNDESQAQFVNLKMFLGKQIPSTVSPGNKFQAQCHSIGPRTPGRSTIFLNRILLSTTNRRWKMFLRIEFQSQCHSKAAWLIPESSEARFFSIIWLYYYRPRFEKLYKMILSSAARFFLIPCTI